MIDNGWVQYRSHGFFQADPPAPHENAQGGQQRPEETFPAVAERMGVAGGPRTAEYTDE